MSNRASGVETQCGRLNKIRLGITDGAVRKISNMEYGRDGLEILSREFIQKVSYFGEIDLLEDLVGVVVS